ncbi:MAG TPA: NAD(P)-dependent oxidoreductase [Methylophaga sp.]|nr:NAD(P)-dependent oxidoreductase [Methylophaga sp.]
MTKGGGVSNKTKIGIVGTGFIAYGVAKMLLKSSDMTVSKILTRRKLDFNDLPQLPQSLYTQSIQELIDESDLILECSGDVLHATRVISEVVKTDKKVITIDAEFQVTSASYFIKRGAYISEADGDQPGCLARLKQELVGMGCEPLAYVNLKGFLNPNPVEEEMRYWADKQKLTLSQVTSFTDGTKLQIEQALVANGLNAAIAKEGMIGATVEKLEDLDYLVDAAKALGAPVSEYLLCNGAPPGVLILADHEEANLLPGYLALSRLKTTKKTAYIFVRPFHIPHLEVMNTFRRVINGEGVLINNSSSPTITAGAVAKRQLNPGDKILQGAGGFDARGYVLEIKNHKNAVPICLLQDTPVIRKIEPGQIITFDDVDLTNTTALECYLDSLPE